MNTHRARANWACTLWNFSMYICIKHMGRKFIFCSRALIYTLTLALGPTIKHSLSSRTRLSILTYRPFLHPTIKKQQIKARKIPPGGVGATRGVVYIFIRSVIKLKFSINTTIGFPGRPPSSSQNADCRNSVRQTSRSMCYRWNCYWISIE